MLEEIVAATKERIRAAKETTPVEELPPRLTGFRSLRATIERCKGVPVIAEIKPKSPSSGVLKRQLDVAALARAYERGGAVGISVLTEPEYFGGSLKNLVEAKESTKLPVLRKDFIVDEYQLHESVAHGADTVLLIVACLGNATGDFVKKAEELRLEPMVECHSKEEIELAVRSGAKLIGINNRNLKTLEVDLSTTEELAPLVPKDRIVVSESGISGPGEVRSMLAAGAKAVLVGTALMRAPDPELKLREMVAC